MGATNKSSSGNKALSKNESVYILPVTLILIGIQIDEGPAGGGEGREKP
jgi:hypothetical protein